MSRIHKQVVSVQRNAAVGGPTGNSGFTLPNASAPAQITKHSAFLLTAEAVGGVTLAPVHYLASGATLSGATLTVLPANSPLYVPTRLHSFTGLSGGSVTFLA
jgi:hypothetical protein